MTGNYVRNDPEVEGLLVLLDGMSGGNGSNAIVASERRGQQQLVASAVMPTKTGDRAEYEAVGFVFGESVEGDDMFTHCTLPEGWSKQASDHDMWSYVVDRHGRRRVAVFYKAAFYDRSAFARVETPNSYLNRVLYEKSEPVLDDTWLTIAVAVEALDAMLAHNGKRAAEITDLLGRGRDDYWTERLAEYATEADAMRDLRDRIAASPGKS